MLFGMRKLTRNWQVGDGREDALLAHVLAHARPGDLDDAIRVIDDFCVTRSVMMNVGDEKGEILDREVQRASPSLLLELGTYCGYSGLSAARGYAGCARSSSTPLTLRSPAAWAHAWIFSSSLPLPSPESSRRCSSLSSPEDRASRTSAVEGESQQLGCFAHCGVFEREQTDLAEAHAPGGTIVEGDVQEACLQGRPPAQAGH
jgi:hypothetical protein